MSADSTSKGSFRKKCQARRHRYWIALLLFVAVYSADNLLRFSPSSLLMRSTTHRSSVKSTMFEISDIQQWQRPIHPLYDKQDSLKIYLYDNLPQRFYDIAECRRKAFATPQPFFIPQTKMGMSNTHADIALISLFEAYPGRTYDPLEADIFVVPYAHATHCLSSCKTSGRSLCRPKDCRPLFNHTIQHGCRHLQNSYSELMASLTYYTPSTALKHLFLLTANTGSLLKELSEMPLILTVGATQTTNPGRILIPYLNDHPLYQPSLVKKRHSEFLNKQRKYIFSYFANPSNKATKKSRNGDPRQARSDFMEFLANHTGRLPPHQFATFKSMTNRWKIHEAYQNSIFCPCLPGDSANQKRFFDVVLDGCIPVVATYSYLDQNGQHQEAWHPHLVPSYQTVPFAKNNPLLRNNVKAAIDYDSFVLKVNSSTISQGGLLQVIQDVLQDPADVRRRQLAMHNIAQRFTYGMGPEAHLYPDAFDLILHSIRVYLDSLSLYNISTPLGL